MLVPAGRWQQRPQAAKSAASVSLPFFDDFSSYRGAPAGHLWAAGGAYVGVDYGPLPPTVGVMTLDALDADGRLYPQASTNEFPADTAMSLPIRLDGLDSIDSVVMSFCYLPGGSGANPWETVGDTPDAQDSLFLDFYSAADSTWHTVWSQRGTPQTGDWARLAVRGDTHCQQQLPRLHVPLPLPQPLLSRIQRQSRHDGQCGPMEHRLRDDRPWAHRRQHRRLPRRSLRQAGTDHAQTLPLHAGTPVSQRRHGAKPADDHRQPLLLAHSVLLQLQHT